MPYQSHLLSTAGSDRATAYMMSNKVVTLAGRTHVVWTDAVARTMGRTYDQASGQWSAPLFLGDGCDNHNTPCLTADARGRLHLAYGPHGVWDHARRLGDWPSGAFKYAVALDPHTLAGLDRCEPPFGYAGTYACLVCLPDGADAMVYRGGEHPSSVMFQRQTPQGGWTQARALMTESIAPQYTHHGAQMVCDRHGRLYVAAHFYAAQRPRNRAYSIGLCALISPDGGATWTDWAGRSSATPIRHPQAAVPLPDDLFDPQVFGLALDAADTPWLLTFNARTHDRRVLLLHDDHGRWESFDVGPFLPPDRVAVYGGLCLDSRNRLHLALTAVTANEPSTEDGAHGKNWNWGDPTSEVFHLVSHDGARTFDCRQISPTDPTTPHWLPSISRSDLFHPVEQPVILYTRGKTLAPDAGTKVYAVMTDHVL